MQLLKLTLISLILCPLFALSQIREVSLTDQVNLSSDVFEGKVISSRCEWDINQHNIYTIYTIDVAKRFKGTVSATKEIAVLGGKVGLQMQKTSHTLKVKVGDYGIFSGKPENANFVGNSSFLKSSTGAQGFIKFDKYSNNAYSSFGVYNNIESEVYKKIELATGINRSILKEIEWKPLNQDKVSPFTKFRLKDTPNKSAKAITNFNPTTATAGTETTITITGSGFGAAAGTVRFSNGDDGGATFVDGLATEIISWNDNTIVVEVYQDAGTGPIQIVTNGGGTTFTSGGSLTVSYAHLNAEFDPGSGEESYGTRHVDRNGNGGYIWQMQTDFEASAGNAAFMRAFDSWRCDGTNIKWETGAVTTTDVVANDNINIIRFDNGGELPGGVLGRCTSRWSGCGGATIEWYVEELDIVFDDGTNWNFDAAAPSFTEYDFESVAVHELGHGHQLGHVINTNEIMHFSISNGEQQRVLSANDIAGGNFVMAKSTGGAVCSQAVMTSHSCGAAPVAAFSGTPTTLCRGHNVTFTDASTETPTGWIWNFGDGGSSTSQNPSYTYAAAGTYTVTLTATNASGSDDEVKSNYITVDGIQDSAFSYSSAIYSTDDGVQSATITGVTGGSFSSSPAGLSLTSAGVLTPSTSTLGSYTITYLTPGACFNTSEESVTIIAPPSGAAPVAAFSSSATTICAGESVAFTDASTESPTGWSWNFGDGGSSTSQNPTYTYATAGTYTVTLSATNASGSDDEVKNNHITVNALENAAFNYSSPSYSTIDGVQNVTITGTPGGTFNSAPVGLTINAAGSITPSTSNVGTYTITYETPGTCSASSMQNVEITDPPPVVVTTELKPSYCGATATSMSNVIYANSVSGATAYRFRFEAGGIDYTYIRHTNLVRPYELGLPYGQTFNAFVNWRDATGAWQTEGSSCNYTTPGIPTTNLKAAYCDATGTSMSSVIYAEKIIGATAYKFRFEFDGTDYSFIRHGNLVRPYELELDPGTTYEAYVSWRDGSGNWQAEGAMCNYTTPASALDEGITIKPDNEITSNEKSITIDEIKVEDNWTIKAYPNPVVDQLRVNWTGIENGASINLMDLSGRTHITKESNNENGLDIYMGNLSSGIYLLRVQNGDQVKILKIQKQ